MRFLFFGNGIGAIECLKVLTSKYSKEDIIVIAPFGGRLHYWNESLDEYCKRNGIECICPEKVNSDITYQKFEEFMPNIIFSVYYNQILGERILNLCKHAINFHPSLLPKYKGTAPLIWAIVKGEKETGITSHEMTKKVDTGKIYGQVKIKISEDETGFGLYTKAIKATRKLFLTVLKDIENGTLRFSYPQGEGSYFSNKTPRVNEIKPKIQMSIDIYNIVRALAKPLPMAYILIDDKKIFINKVRMMNNEKIAELFNNSNMDLIDFEGKRYLRSCDGVLLVDDLRNESNE